MKNYGKKVQNAAIVNPVDLEGISGMVIGGRNVAPLA